MIKKDKHFVVILSSVARKTSSYDAMMNNTQKSGDTSEWINSEVNAVEKGRIEACIDTYCMGTKDKSLSELERISVMFYVLKERGGG